MKVFDVGWSKRKSPLQLSVNAIDLHECLFDLNVDLVNGVNQTDDSVFYYFCEYIDHSLLGSVMGQECNKAMTEKSVSPAADCNHVLKRLSLNPENFLFYVRNCKRCEQVSRQTGQLFRQTVQCTLPLHKNVSVNYWLMVLFSQSVVLWSCWV